MKRIISLLLCLVLMTALAAPVSAASPEVIFTADSGFTPGCTVTVDEIATGESIFDNGSDSELEAYLEGHIQYYWMRNDSYYADGTSITIREEDRGCQFYCIGAMYSDDDHTQQFGTIYSRSSPEGRMTSSGSGTPAENIRSEKFSSVSASGVHSPAATFSAKARAARTISSLPP